MSDILYSISYVHEIPYIYSMRTVILVGLLSIASAIKPDWRPGYEIFTTFVLFAAAIMDCADFYKDHKKK